MFARPADQTSKQKKNSKHVKNCEECYDISYVFCFPLYCLLCLWNIWDMVLDVYFKFEIMLFCCLLVFSFLGIGNLFILARYSLLPRILHHTTVSWMLLFTVAPLNPYLTRLLCFQVIVSIVGLLLFGKVLEPLWGAKELLKFIFIVNLSTSACVFVTTIVLYYITQEESYL